MRILWGSLEDFCLLSLRLPERGLATTPIGTESKEGDSPVWSLRFVWFKDCVQSHCLVTAMQSLSALTQKAKYPHETDSEPVV